MWPAQDFININLIFKSLVIKKKSYLITSEKSDFSIRVCLMVSMGNFSGRRLGSLWPWSIWLILVSSTVPSVAHIADTVYRFIQLSCFHDPMLACLK